ncbi:MAG: hypothetical protein SFV32_13095 [Opitutaceae bacterium]|nr:hypothetical protein [Opitutaceae bacterium]
MNLSCMAGLALAALSVVWLGADAGSREPIKYAILNAAGNRVYTEVTIKVFDPRTERVTILCKEGIANVSLTDFPEKDRPRIKAGRKLDNPLTAGSPDSIRMPPAEAVTDHTAPGLTASDPDSMDGRIEQAVKNRARGYFKFNYTPLGTYDHTGFTVDVKPPVELAGWPGRFRVTGEATFTLHSNRKVIGGFETLGIEIVGFEADVVVQEGKIEILDFKHF